MRTRVVCVLAVALVGLASCRMNDIRSQTIRVPQVKSAAAQKVVQAALGRADGVLTNGLAFGAGTVTVRYDSMKLALKNLEQVIADAGFDANNTPADAKARDALAPECR